ncbi:hypothetical protein [Bradyrhizobium sp. HKCCYLRH1062]|uniref:hypothetical protein n=1 Tax=unclassified Bradyrhizobium TaxID=2631580 RepID=UPI003EBA1259
MVNYVPTKAVRIIAAMAAFSIAHRANAADTVQTLDAKIADAQRAAAEAKKAADSICFDAGKEMGQRDLGQPNDASAKFKKCTDAMQTSSDAIGLIGFLQEQRSHLTGEPPATRYACSGEPSLGAPHPDANGHYTVCPKGPDDHSYKFWIITQVRMQAGNAKETWSDGGIISLRRYSSEAECRAGIARYEDYPSKVPYNLKDSVLVGDVCVQVFIADVRELQ